MVTGAFHEDGLADVADGFGGGTTREERLEIMKDSRIGAYGTLVLVIAVGARASLLTALLDLPPEAIMALTAGAAAFSRALMVDLLSTTRPARSNGLSVLAGQPTRQTGLIALAIGALAAGLAAHSFLSWRVAILSCRRRLGTRRSTGARHAQDRWPDGRCVRRRPGDGGDGHAGRFRGSRLRHLTTLRSCLGAPRITIFAGETA